MKRLYALIMAFVLTALLITLMLPASGIKSEYKKGYLWTSSDLVAPFSFPILKTQQEYDADILAAEKRYIPIYTLNDDISTKILDDIRSRYHLDFKHSDNHKDSLQITGELFYNRLNELFNKGIINNYDEKFENESNNKTIRIVKNGVVNTVSSSSLLSIDKAKTILSTEFGDNPLLGQLQIENYIGANVIYNEPLNTTDKEQMLASVSNSKGFVAEGVEIIKRGERIDDTIYQTLMSYEHESKLRNGDINSYIVIIGNFLYTSIVLALSFSFLFFFRKEFSKKTGNVLFLLFIYIFMVSLCYTVTLFDNLNLFLIPFAIVPFYIVTFYDIRMSIFEYVSVLMICVPFSSAPMEFFFINLFAGLAGVFTVQNSYYRQKLFVAIGVILLVYIISFIAVSFMVEQDTASIRWSDMIWFPLNILIFMALYQLVYLFEKIFGFVTDITLFELCDTNHFLLRELAEKAPGTFQHSIQVANLAEAAAKEIGANPLYARTGALYHDIGKMENSLYFIENNFTDTNPHSSIEPLKSVEIIKQHITDGVRLAKKHNLPNIIIDFINTHHAKSIIYFFYHQYKESSKETEDEIDVSLFRYDGPLPKSKEASICMMADTVEAASRSMKNHTTETISKLVDSVINVQISEGNFESSALTYGEITRVKEVLKSKLEGIYHLRIEYPKR